MKSPVTHVLAALALSVAALTTAALPASAAKHKTTTTTAAPLPPFCRDLHTAAKYQSETLPNPLSPRPPTSKELTKAFNNEAAAFAEAAQLAPTTKAYRQLNLTARWLQAAARAPKTDTLDVKNANAAFLAFTSSPRASTWCSGY
jgi:hypothetical protein